MTWCFMNAFDSVITQRPKISLHSVQIRGYIALQMKTNGDPISSVLHTKIAKEK